VRGLIAVALLAAASSAAAQNPGTYQVGTIPVAGSVGTLEVALHRDWATELGAAALGQGTYEEQNPLAYLSLVAPYGWLHFDGVQNLRLSVAFQEFLYREIPPLGVKASHEERGVARARLQQPRGAGALYEMLQLDVRSFVDPGGTHRIAYRPRFRMGQGFNLDAARISSVAFYQEVGFHVSEPGFYARPFEFFRVYVGYLWTTRRGTFVTLGLLGQIGLNPAATRYDVLWGPVLGFSHRFRPPPPDAPPPEPSDEAL
jgi:hypothetical protein